MKPKATIPRHVQSSLEKEAPDEKEALEKVWALTAKETPPMPAEAIDAAVAQFEQQLRTSPTSTRRTPLYFLQNTWKIAATLLILVLAAAWYVTGTVSHETPAGSTASFSLPDGSTVVLNSASKIAYGRKMWGRHRAVHLEGEAFFDVTRGSRPFVVTTMNARIQVVGTAFNVNTWPADSLHTILQVTEGTVHLTANNATDAPTVVQAGQESWVVGNAGMPTPPAAIDEALARMWLNGGVASIDQSLTTLAQMLTRKYAVPIEVDSTLQGTILTWIDPTPKGVQQSLSVVCELASCAVSRTETGYLLTPLP